MNHRPDTKSGLLPACILLGLLSLPGGLNAQTLGESAGPQVLLLPVNARTAALGDASIALIDAYSGVWTNPSTLGFVKSSSLDYTAYRITAGATLQHVGLVITTESAGGFAARFEGLQGEGKELLAGIGYGRKITEVVSLGLNLDMLYAQSDSTPATAFVGDIGVLYSPGKYATYAVTLGGVGSDYDVRSPGVRPAVEDKRVPRVFAAGLAFDYPFSDPRRGILFSMQSEKLLTQRHILYQMGVEYKMFPFFRMRAGLKIRGTESEPRLGLGLAFLRFSIDYGYRYSRRDLGPSHLFTIAASWQ